MIFQIFFFYYRYLTYVDDKWVFLSLSLALRVFESLGATGAMVAAFSLTAVTFPESVASTFVRIFHSTVDFIVDIFRLKKNYYQIRNIYNVTPTPVVCTRPGLEKDKRYYIEETIFLFFFSIPYFDILIFHLRTKNNDNTSFISGATRRGEKR